MSDDDHTQTGRPKRATRLPNKYLHEGVGTTSTRFPRGTKRKAKYEEDDEGYRPSYEVEFLLQNPRSILTRMNISDLINVDIWNILSSDSQSLLASLLPPTAFADCQPSMSPSHPSQRHKPSTSQQAPPSTHDPALLLPNFFTDPHFLSAAHTFQDHLFSSYLTPTSSATLRTWLDGVHSGAIHAPWKDEVWEQEHPEGREILAEGSQKAKEGSTADIRLSHLAKNRVIDVGDVLAYKRTFAASELVIEKDVIIESIHPKSYALTVLLPPGTTINLPPAILPISSPSQEVMDAQLVEQEPLRRVVITSPTQLETAILDINGRLERGRRPNGNAWKSFVVWRLAEEMEGLPGEEEGKGHREHHGTLFYLRGCFSQDRAY